MAVPVEGICVIARRNRLDELISDSSKRYIADYPNAIACADNYLVRRGLMGPDEVRSLVHLLESLAFVHLDAKGKSQDVVVVEQLGGTRPRPHPAFNHAARYAR
jgi:hypothetical protein